MIQYTRSSYDNKMFVYHYSFFIFVVVVVVVAAVDSHVIYLFV